MDLEARRLSFNADQIRGNVWKFNEYLPRRMTIPGPRNAPCSTRIGLGDQQGQILERGQLCQKYLSCHFLFFIVQHSCRRPSFIEKISHSCYQLATKLQVSCKLIARFSCFLLEMDQQTILQRLYCHGNKHDSHCVIP